MKSSLASVALIACTQSAPPSDNAHHFHGGDGFGHHGRYGFDVYRPPTNLQESFAYVVGLEFTEPGATASPDAVYVVDLQPGSPTYAQILSRTDMPHVGDELHHIGYNWDNTKLEVDGLFSARAYIFDVDEDPIHPRLIAENDGLPTESGYAVPHTVIGLPTGTNLVTMIGSSSFGFPGGIIEVDARTGQFVRPFGADSTRDYNNVGPKYMYDFGFKQELNRGISTTFGRPADVASHINVPGLGDTVSVWDLQQRKVIQTASLGTNCGALEVRWTYTFGEPVGYTNCPGTGALWVWEDYDGDGVYSFHETLTGQIGVPADIVMSLDSKYLYIQDWIFGRVFQVDISNRLNPKIVATVNVPYAQMGRLSQDGKRLFITNSILSTWDDDPALGGPRNVDYGIYLIETGDPGMTLVGNPLVDFRNVQKANGVGRARPHQMFFDPALVWPTGFH